LRFQSPTISALGRAWLNRKALSLMAALRAQAVQLGLQFSTPSAVIVTPRPTPRLMIAAHDRLRVAIGGKVADERPGRS